MRKAYPFVRFSAFRNCSCSGSSWYATSMRLLFMSVVACSVSPMDEVISEGDAWVNDPPFITATWLESEQADRDAVWWAGAEGEDPEGESLSWSYVWSVDGQPVQEGASPLLLPGWAGRGSEIEVIVTASDPWGAQSLPHARVVEVGNAAPKVGVVNLIPSPPTAGTELRCDAIDVDPDGDATTQEVLWYVNGMTPFAPGSVLEAGLVRRGDVVSCGVSSTDGVVVSEERESDSWLVENAPPNVVGAWISPEKPVLTDRLTLMGLEVVDADLDEVSTRVSWWADGVLVGYGLQLEPPLVTNATFHAEVTPFDGWVEGEIFQVTPVRVGD